MVRVNLPDKKKNNCRGFTIMEVMAILIILGIIAAVAICRISFSGNELFTERDLLKANLRFAQVKALTNNDDTATTWGIGFTNTSYTLLRNDAPANVSFPFSTSSSHTVSSGITLTVPANVTYNLWGSPGAANITITLTEGETKASFRITGNTGYMQ